MKVDKFEVLLKRIYKEVGILPKDYRTIGEYMEAVLSKTATESLVAWDGMEEGKAIDPFVKAELESRTVVLH